MKCDKCGKVYVGPACSVCLLEAMERIHSSAAHGMGADSEKYWQHIDEIYTISSTALRNAKGK